MPSEPPYDVDESTTDVIGARIVAHIVDSLIIAVAVFAVFFAIYAPVAILVGEAAGMALAFVPSILPPLVYTVGLEASWDGQTVGKRLVGIRVVNEYGEEANIGPVIGRNIPLLFNLGPLSVVAALIAMAVSDTNQRIFDSIAGTAVVRA
ncbi:MAG: RDD family protein [Halococcoides sp.]